MAHGKRVRKLCIGKVVVKNDFFFKKIRIRGDLDTGVL